MYAPWPTIRIIDTLQRAETVGRQLSGLLSSSLIGRMPWHEERNRLFCIADSWKSQPVQVRRYRGCHSSLALSYTRYISSSNGFFLLGYGSSSARRSLTLRVWPGLSASRIVHPPPHQPSPFIHDPRSSASRPYVFLRVIIYTLLTRNAQHPFHLSSSSSSSFFVLFSLLLLLWFL